MGKLLQFSLIHHDHSPIYDPIESRLHHVTELVSLMPMDDEEYLFIVQQKLEEAIFWYTTYIENFSEGE